MGCGVSSANVAVAVEVPTTSGSAIKAAGAEGQQPLKDEGSVSPAATPPTSAGTDGEDDTGVMPLPPGG